jgi:serine/threonine-protein kinase
LAYVQHHPSTGRDIWLLDTAGVRASRPLLASPFDESAPRFAPDGRLLAYVSNESGRNEIYVRPSGDSSRKWKVSREGGAEPVWAPGGRELFFRAGDRVLAAAVDSSADVRVSEPRVLFEGKFEKGTIDAANYDVGADPLRFVMIRAVERESEQNQMHVALNWAPPAMAAAFPRR